MSIYGPEPPEAELATGPDNHALKARLDAQVGLRVLKAGDTMTGELQMGGNMIRGLPQVYPPSDYLGDEAVSWSQIVRLAGGIGDMGGFTKSYRAQPQAPYYRLGRREWSSRWRLWMVLW